MLTLDSHIFRARAQCRLTPYYRIENVAFDVASTAWMEHGFLTLRIRLDSYSHVLPSLQDILRALQTEPLIVGITTYSNLITYRGGFYSYSDQRKQQQLEACASESCIQNANSWRGVEHDCNVSSVILPCHHFLRDDDYSSPIVARKDMKQKYVSLGPQACSLSEPNARST